MSKCELVGILNVTPDSFSDGGMFYDPDHAVKHAAEMFNQGASIIDVGAESTNPWSSPLEPDEEWARFAPVLRVLVKNYPGQISVDTYHAETAKKALEAGITIINDVTMFRNPAMVKLAGKHKPVCIVSHLSPKSKTISDAHKNPPTTTIEEVKSELLAKRDELLITGVPAENIILDPGIGFGKTMELNKQLLTFAKEVPGIDVMIGYSRKRFLGKHRMGLEPNLEAGKIAITSGARYLRVHDVAGHVQLLS